MLGTVTEALEGLVSCLLSNGAVVFDSVGFFPKVVDVLAWFLGCLKYDGGKCFALYASCTFESS